MLGSTAGNYHWLVVSKSGMSTENCIKKELKNEGKSVHKVDVLWKPDL